MGDLAVQHWLGGGSKKDSDYVYTELTLCLYFFAPL